MRDSIKQNFFIIFKFQFLFRFIKRRLFPDTITRNFIAPQSFKSKILEGILKNNSRYNPSTEKILKTVIYKDQDKTIKLNIDLNEYTQCGYYFKIPNDILKKLIIRGGDVFIDIGSNVGVFSMMALHYFKNVYAIEPMPEVREKLTNNYDQTLKINANNKLGAFIILPNAISNKNTKTFLYRNPLNLGGSKLGKFSDEYKRSSSISTGWDNVEVESKTLDTLVEKQNIKNISILKIDVEGHEFEAMAGAKESIIKFNPIIYIEISSEENFKNIKSILPANYLIWNPNTKTTTQNWDSLDLILSQNDPF